MKKIGIICEYNPFHRGHAYQIAKIRETNADAAIVCLMSGHATQRGELAIADKYTRAAMAVSCGADIVLELPYPYSSASAAYFAGAGVAILDALGVDALSFGSECDDPQLLLGAVNTVESEDFTDAVRERQKRGEGSAQAYFAELESRMKDESTRFLSNDILALAYIQAIRAIESPMQPMPLKRCGSAYLASETEEGKLPSATALRKRLQENINESLIFVPENAEKHLREAINRGYAPTNVTAYEHAVLSFLRTCPPEKLAGIAEMHGGLGNRLHEAAMSAVTLSELLTRAASKSYPTARLRRAILFAMTGVAEEDLKRAPGYLMLLAADARGRELMREWKTNAPIPIFAKFADAALCSARASRQAACQSNLDALFTLATPTRTTADFWIKQHPIMYS